MRIPCHASSSNIEIILIASILIKYVTGGRKLKKSIVSRCLYFIFLLVTNNFTDIFEGFMHNDSIMACGNFKALIEI